MLFIEINYIYWRTLKTQHLDNSFILCLEKEGRTIIWIVNKEHSFVRKTWKTCPSKVNLMHLNVNFLR